MSSLKEVRNQLTFSHFKSEITDEEFLLLYDLNTSTNLDQATLLLVRRENVFVGV